MHEDIPFGWISTSSSAHKNYRTHILWNMKLISTFTQCSVQTLSLAKLIYPTPSHYVFWRSISIFPSYLLLGLTHGFLSSCFPQLQFCMHFWFTPLWWLSYVHAPHIRIFTLTLGFYILGRGGGRQFSNAHNLHSKTYICSEVHSGALHPLYSLDLTALDSPVCST